MYKLNNDSPFKENNMNIETTIKITELGVGEPTETKYDKVRIDHLNVGEAKAVMAAEALPSLDIESGQLLVNLSADNTVEQVNLERSYHKLIEANMRTANGNDFALECVGLNFDSKVTAVSSYKGHVGSVEQYEISFDNNAKALVVAAAIKGYVQDQESVTIRSFVSAEVGSNDVWSFDCGRVITNEEMSNIRSLLTECDINPDDDVALVTSKDGIDILNLRDMRQSMFRHIPSILSEVLNGKVYAYSNKFANETYHYGYIGADSLSEAQDKYLEIIAEFNSCNDQFNVSLDLLEQKRKENREITSDFITQHSRSKIANQFYAA